MWVPYLCELSIPDPKGETMTGIHGAFGVFGRRQLITGVSAGIAGSLCFGGKAMGDASAEILHSEEAIHQETDYKSSPARIYEAILDARQFDKLTAMSPEMKAGKSLGTETTKISREVGGTFTIFGGHILGRNLELVPHQRIVQAWRVVDWDAGHYSIARFELTAQGAGTKIVFDHTGFPKGQAEHLANGWKSHYWQPLQEYLG